MSGDGKGNGYRAISHENLFENLTAAAADQRLVGDLLAEFLSDKARELLLAIRDTGDPASPSLADRAFLAGWLTGWHSGYWIGHTEGQAFERNADSTLIDLVEEFGAARWRRLTNCHREVVIRMKLGLTDQQIATALDWSLRNLRYHGGEAARLLGCTGIPEMKRRIGCRLRRRDQADSAA